MKQKIKELRKEYEADSEVLDENDNFDEMVLVWIRKFITDLKKLESEAT